VTTAATEKTTAALPVLTPLLAAFFSFLALPRVAVRLLLAAGGDAFFVPGKPGAGLGNQPDTRNPQYRDKQPSRFDAPDD
jgi:hypothetical protein